MDESPKYFAIQAAELWLDKAEIARPRRINEKRLVDASAQRDRAQDQGETQSNFRGSKRRHLVTGLCRSMIYQMEADLLFPQRVKIGTRAVGWVDKEVNAWLMKRIAASRR
ncbi:MAG: AlpA family phage regulatory protein [Bryobacteraceae bacterium]|jgi:prophage regulatory protein